MLLLIPIMKLKYQVYSNGICMFYKEMFYVKFEEIYHGNSIIPF